MSRNRAGRGATPASRSRQAKQTNISERRLRMFLVPCSCGTTFSVAEDYDRQGTHWSRYLICPGCGKRHDPKNRLLQVGYQREGFWQVDDC
ncbi:MAG TPA: hypothetical protein VMU61_15330 [Candidatus Aquilonibacter sp.]|nr:hypothetical protein [Candidatus Aquilonibacter sp.]